MRLTFLAAVVTAVVGRVTLDSLTARADALSTPSNQGIVVTTRLPGGYIVELAPTSKSKRGLSVHDEFLEALDKRAAGRFVTRKKYEGGDLFNGLAVVLKTPEDLVNLQSLPNVISVKPITVYPMPQTLNKRAITEHATPPIVDGQSTHKMTGVDKAHAAGITGKGIKIAVIDTGVDYTHPSLGAGFGPGHKVIGGYDLVGDDYTGGNTPVPDNDPIDCFGHGTHVAGIIGANPGNKWNISGVAYDASILAYRVFGCNGGVGDDVLIDAFLRADKEGADILSLSIGGVDGWSDTPTALVASRVAKKGRVVTIAAGNDGEAGAMFTSSPATGTDVIMTASVENTYIPIPWFETSANKNKILYTVASWPNHMGDPLEIDSKPYPIYPISLDTTLADQACEPLADDVDLTGYAVLVRATFSNLETGCGYWTQAENLEARNASLVIYYDVNDPYLVPIFGVFNAVIISKPEDVTSLIDQLKKDPKLTVKFPQATPDDSATIPQPVEDYGGQGGLVSFFSSIGPSNELLFKPAVAAPGGNITSTLPINQGSWGIESGTSMATPFMAGSAALLLQSKGKGVAKDVRAILQSTSSSVPASKDKKALPETLARQGAGLIDVYSALNTKTRVSPAELLTNDTTHWKRAHTITLRNNAKKAQTYKLSHQAAGTTVSVASGKTDFTMWPIPLIDAPSLVTITPNKITIQPGKSATIKVDIQPPKKVDAKTLPIISGWINVAGSLGDRVKVSYMGIAGALNKAQSISTGNNWVIPTGLPALIPLNDDGPELAAQKGPRNYTLGSELWPVFAWSQATPSRRVTLDLISFDSKVKSTIPDPLAHVQHTKRAYWSDWWPGLNKAKQTDSYSKVPTIGAILEFREEPRSGLSRSAPPPWEALNFPTKFANGTVIVPGQYRLLLRSLRLGGNEHDEADYDVYVSQQVGIVLPETASQPSVTTLPPAATGGPA